MKKEVRFALLYGAISAATGVVLGALGAHALREVLTPRQLESFNTGVDYQVYHALGLLLMGLLMQTTELALRWVVRLQLIGILLFSGSIYLLSTGPYFSSFSWKWLGPITPIGGLLLIASWALLMVKIIPASKRSS